MNVSTTLTGDICTKCVSPIIHIYFYLNKISGSSSLTQVKESNASPVKRATLRILYNCYSFGTVYIWNLLTQTDCMNEPRAKSNDHFLDDLEWDQFQRHMPYNNLLFLLGLTSTMLLCQLIMIS